MARFGDLATQSKNFWQALGMGPRVTLLSFIGGTILLIVGLSVWSSQPDYVLLFGGLTTEDAAAISTHLNDDKIPFRYEASRGAIYVAASKVNDARLSLASQGLPKNSTEGFELFDKISFGTTEYVQRVNYLRALQGSLARNLQSMESVETATVSLSIPEDDVFKRDAREAKASVMLKLRSGRTLQREQIMAIRHLVASTVPKLKIQNVAVMDSTGRLFSRFEEDEALGGHGMSDEEFGMQHRIETALANKVQTLLERVVGPGQVAVQVTAQMNLERVVRDLQKIDPDSQVLLEESTKTDDAGGGSKGAAGGLPGTASNVPDAAAATAGGGASGSRKQKTVNNRYNYNTTTEHIIPEAGGIKRLSVAVLVAPTKAAGSEEVKARTAKEMETLSEIVRSAVGFSTERQDLVKVEEMPFNTNILPSVGVEPNLLPNYWFELARSYLPDVFALIGIAVMALVFKRLLAALPVAPPPVVHAPKTVSEIMAEAAPQFEDAPPKRTAVAKSMEEVKELVNKNNNQAVNLIRSMLN